MRSKTAIGVGIVLAVLLVGLGSSALLTYYGTMVGTMTGQQSVKIDGNAWDVPTTWTITLVGGDSGSQDFTITNDASVPAGISVTSTITPDGEGIELVYLVNGNPVDEGIPFPIPPKVGGVAGQVTLTIVVSTVPSLQPGNYTITTTLNVVP